MLQVLSLEFKVADVPCKLVTINPCNQSKPEIRMHFQHSHSGCEIHYVSSGALSVDCIGTSYKLSEGQMLILPPGVYHYVRELSDNIERMDMLIEINRSHRSTDPQADSFLQGLFRVLPILLSEEDPHRELFELLRKIQRTAMNVQQSTFLQREWLKAMCQELVLLMGTVAQAHHDHASSHVLDGADPNTDRYIMDQFFNHNYQGNSDMAMLAKELNMSVRQTGRVLQKTYGKGFREKMNECRLAVALDLIRNTTKSMAEISDILGYGGPTNFSSFVKQQTGKTPAQLRKEK